MSRRLISTLLLPVLTLALPAMASDHDDTPELKAIPRHEARISDLHAFTAGDRLVLALATNPAIPVGATDYTFPDDLTLRILIDNNSAVSFADPSFNSTYGGQVVEPAKIAEDISFEVTFRADGTWRLHTTGLRGSEKKDLRVFVGLRDDPFIRGPRIGRNIAAIVFDIPLAHVLDNQPELLIWSTSKVPDIPGPMADLGARSLRSQLAPNLALNTTRPREHLSELGFVPDVVIYDTSRAAGFPNGRRLEDDVVDLVANPGVLATDAPFPATNDVPFLPNFPYLAPPH